MSVGWQLSHSGFHEPVQVTSAHDGSGRLFVVTQVRPGPRVRERRAASSPTSTCLALVSTGGEQGLLSVAFRRGSHDPRVCVAYTAKNGTLVVVAVHAEVAVRERHHDARRHRAAGPAPDLHQPQRRQLAFGPDGCSTSAPATAAAAATREQRAEPARPARQDPAHRRDARAAAVERYCIPSSNPFATSTVDRARDLAVRAAQPVALLVRPGDGDVWIGDVGQDRYEEIDVVAAGHGG